jgi:hypothetical protein
MGRKPPDSGIGVTGRQATRRLGSIARIVLVLSTIVALVGWGIFAVITVVPNPSDPASVFGSFTAVAADGGYQVPVPSWFPAMYNVPPNSTVNFVFVINVGPSTGNCHFGQAPKIARSGTFWVLCTMPRANSTLTSSWRNYVNFNIIPDRDCCIQTYYSWVSSPTGNLTGSQGGGGLFEASQEGNYSAHISNTIRLFPGMTPPGNVTGTFSFTLGHVVFLKPFFTSGLVTLGVAVLSSSYWLLTMSRERGKRRSSDPRERADRVRERPVPRELSDQWVASMKSGEKL